MRWATTATTAQVKNTAPTASEAMPITCRRNRPAAMDQAPSINSGGRKMTSTSPGSIDIAGSPGTNASEAPPVSNATDGGNPSRWAA